MSSPRNKQSPSLSSEGPWRNDNPFGPPQMTRSFSSGSLRRIRNTLSKLSPSAFAEKELLRKQSIHKVPLTHRNVDNFVSAQLLNEDCRSNRHSQEIQVAEWLEQVC